MPVPTDQLLYDKKCVALAFNYKATQRKIAIERTQIGRDYNLNMDHAHKLCNACLMLILNESAHLIASTNITVLTFIVVAKSKHLIV